MGIEIFAGKPTEAQIPISEFTNWKISLSHKIS